MKRLSLCLFLISLFISLSAQIIEPGVSKSLAEQRALAIKNLEYNLSFNITSNKKDSIKAEEVVSFDLEDKQQIVLDFRELPEKIKAVLTFPKNKKVEWRFENEHIVISEKATKKGRNAFRIIFNAGEQSLNRSEEYMYTLFVPDRARTCFPCFDQPDMKARFNLTLNMPKDWTAVTNSPLMEVQGSNGDSQKVMTTTGKLDLIPTYLFAFAVGKFQHQEYESDGMKIGAYYRETDPMRLDQLPEIFRQVKYSLDWQEKFTGQKYGFAKYDFVVLPGFQFGGMEHTGCTFYNDNTLFLNYNPTPDEILSRANLIAHETSHMWFGDLVTMKWFNDVWTKEVFANYFAAEICRPLFPEVNHDLNWLKTFKAAAVSEDRTEGHTAIQQPLDNLRNAGLIYNNIIYNKAPLVMRDIVDMMGKDAFQRGIQRYVKQYAYSNATWDDLISILDDETPEDLRAYSDKWVKQAYYPTIKAESFKQNADGRQYGYIEMTSEQIDSLMDYWPFETDAVARQSFLMTLYENYLNKKIEDEKWTDFILNNLRRNDLDPLTNSTLVSYLSQPLWQLNKEKRANVELALWELSKTHKQHSTQLQIMRFLTSNAITDKVNGEMYVLWKYQENGLLGVNDYMTLAYELALRYPTMAADIIKEQHDRLDNPDRQRQFDFISRAVVGNEQQLDELFASLKEPANRRIEPWAGSLLYYLNHPLRDKESVKYIRPALEMLKDIQRTGDIFFPSRWCNSLLSGHRSDEARTEVEAFLNSNPDYPQLLKNKILVAAYTLNRVKK